VDVEWVEVVHAACQHPRLRSVGIGNIGNVLIVEEFAIDSKLRNGRLSQKTLHHKTDRDLSSDLIRGNGCRHAGGELQARHANWVNHLSINGICDDDCVGRKVQIIKVSKFTHTLKVIDYNLHETICARLVKLDQDSFCCQTWT